MRSSIHIRTVAAVSLTCVTLAAAPAFAQTPSLGSVARQEQERRKTTSPPKKVLTNADLPNVVSPGVPQAPPSETPQAESPAPPVDPPAAPEPEKDEAYWRARIGEPRETLRRDEILLVALQSRVNALAADFVGRDDPYQRARIGDDRLKALAELDRVQSEIAQLKQQIEDIEEEARRAGVPPGWLR